MRTCSWRGISRCQAAGSAQPQREGMGPTSPREGQLNGKGWESLAPTFADKLRKPLEGAAEAHWRRFSEGGVGTTALWVVFILCTYDTSTSGGLAGWGQGPPPHGLLIPRDSKQLPENTPFLCRLANPEPAPEQPRPLSNSHPRPMLCCWSPGGTRPQSPTVVHTTQSEARSLACAAAERSPGSGPCCSCSVFPDRPLRVPRGPGCCDEALLGCCKRSTLLSSSSLCVCHLTGLKQTLGTY